MRVHALKLPKSENSRFNSQLGLRITVQVPETHSQNVVDAVLTKDALTYGDYDSVTFKTALGTQQFKSIGTGRNSATRQVVEVPCCELSFFLPDDEVTVIQVLKLIYSAHPYEEPVIFIEPCTRTLHIRGIDEDNPNRFWNNEPQDWVPTEHR
jgi:hypothetical protein